MVPSLLGFLVVVLRGAVEKERRMEVKEKIVGC
jgi:hypothetical protein